MGWSKLIWVSFGKKKTLFNEKFKIVIEILVSPAVHKLGPIDQNICKILYKTF